MSVAIIEKSGTTLRFRPKGSLDGFITPQLNRELQPHLDGVSQIVIDFSDVEYVTSSGLRLLLLLEQRMAEIGGEMQVVNASETVRKIFALVGFKDVVNIVID